MIKLNKFLVLILLPTVLFGCSYFTKPLENPLINDYQKSEFWTGKRSYGSSSLTASRRMILFKLQKDDFQRICAEPPPTAADELSRTLQAAITASVKLAEDSGEGSASLLTSLNATVKQLQKPMGIQYEQDLLFALCQLYMNKADLPVEFLMSEFKDIANNSKQILMSEITKDKQAKAELSNISNISSILKLNNNVRVRINDIGYYKDISLLVRKYKNGLSEVEEWHTIPNSIVNKNIISGNFTNDMSLVGNEIIEVGISITPKPGADQLYYLAPEKAVFYVVEGEKATIDNFDANQIPADNALIIAIKMPANVSIAYPSFMPSGATVTGSVRFPDNNVASLSEIKYLKKIDENTYSYNISLSDELTKKLLDARSTGDVNFNLQFVSMGHDVPNIIPPKLNKLAKPASVTDLSSIPDKLTNGKYPITLSWNYSEDKITNFYIERIKSGAKDYINIDATVGAKLRTYIDYVDEPGVYTYRVSAFNHTKASDPVVSKVTITKSD